MLAVAEVDTGTVVSLLFAIVALVSAWIGWARWAHKAQTDTAAVTTNTLREFIHLLTKRQESLEAELAALRAVQTTQTEEIATLKEKVRQLESQRDALLAENQTQKGEIISLNVRIAERDAEIARLTAALRKAEDETQESEMLRKRLAERLEKYEKAANGIQP